MSTAAPPHNDPVNGEPAPVMGDPGGQWGIGSSGSDAWGGGGASIVVAQVDPEYLARHAPYLSQNLRPACGVPVYTPNGVPVGPANTNNHTTDDEEVTLSDEFGFYPNMYSNATIPNYRVDFDGYNPQMPSLLLRTSGTGEEDGVGRDVDGNVGTYADTVLAFALTLVFGFIACVPIILCGSRRAKLGAAAAMLIAIGVALWHARF